MGKIFGISNLKPTSAFPSLEKPFSLKAPVKQLDKHSTAKTNVEKDTFVKTNVPAKKAHRQVKK